MAVKHEAMIKKLSSDFKEYAKDLVIGFIGDCGDKYMVSLTSPKIRKGEFMLDAYYTWDKETGKITPIAIAANRKLHKMAEAHTVYLRE